MSKETKPEMTAEEFLRCWIEDKKDIPLAQEHLNSVIRGKLVEYDKWLVDSGLQNTNEITSERLVEMFLSNNQ